MYSKAQSKLDEAHKTLAKQGLQLKAQSLRGGNNLHDTQFYLYNVENFLLVGDVSLDRSKNKPETDFIKEEDQEVTVDEGLVVKCDQIASVRDLMQGQARVRVLMRMHFLVHTYINLYVWDPENEAELVGYRMRERSQATKQSHMLTLDKLVCEMPLRESFNPQQDELTNKEWMQQYGQNEGVYISDFDNFMPRGNPVVNFTPIWPPPEEEKTQSKPKV